MAEVLQALNLSKTGRYVDATVGGGGHAEGLLRATSPTGWLFGCDRDGEALEAARERLREFEGRFELRRGNYSELLDWVEPGSVDGVLFDLGVSSPQLDWAERGFSFQQDGPLDMRMDQRESLTAADLVNDLSEEELARIFWDLGQERHGRRLARGIVKRRQERRIERTCELAELVERLVPRRGQKIHPATRVFQALRMAVNSERKSLEAGLVAAWTLLVKRGRLVVITFHSLEDRVVKAFGRERARGYEIEGEVDLPEFRRPCPPELRWVQKKAVRAGNAEVVANPRARSAQFRVMEKV